MLNNAIISGFPKLLQKRVRKIRNLYWYYHGTVPGFVCSKKCGVMFHDSFMSKRDMHDDGLLVQAMEKHAKTCDGARPKDLPEYD